MQENNLLRTIDCGGDIFRRNLALQCGQSNARGVERRVEWMRVKALLMLELLGTVTLLNGDWCI